MTLDVTSESDLAAARDVALVVGLAVADVEAIYLVGSRAKGDADPESDLDLVAFVGGTLRALSPNWARAGEAPAPGFASSHGEIPLHWQVISVDEIDRADFERNAHFRASPAVLVYERARTVPSPVPPQPRKDVD